MRKAHMDVCGCVFFAAPLADYPLYAASREVKYPQSCIYAGVHNAAGYKPVMERFLQQLDAKVAEVHALYPGANIIGGRDMIHGSSICINDSVPHGQSLSDLTQVMAHPFLSKFTAVALRWEAYQQPGGDVWVCPVICNEGVQKQTLTLNTPL
jgi:hypothetical protein